jgi:hypothetical protein
VSLFDLTTLLFVLMRLLFSPYRRNKIILPDEYDQINRDIYPFFAYKKQGIFKQKLDATFQMPDTFSISVIDGEIITNKTFSEEARGGMVRMSNQLDLLKPFAKYLPNVSVVFSVHDTPRIYPQYEHRLDMLKCASEPTSEICTFVSVYHNCP